MKRIFILFILFHFLLNTAGYYFFFTYNQYTIRQEIHSLISSRLFESSYTRLKVNSPSSNPDFTWLGEDEFKYKGELYDLCGEKTEGNITTFLCIKDKQEEKLIGWMHNSSTYAFGLGHQGKAKHAAAMLHHVITIALLDSPTEQSPPTSKKISFITPCYSLFSIFHLFLLQNSRANNLEHPFLNHNKSHWNILL